MLTGCMGVAYGSVAGRRTSRISLVSALARTVSAIGRYPPAHDLDAQHPPGFLRLVCTHTRTTLASSRLDPAAGIRIGRDGHRHRPASVAFPSHPHPPQTLISSNTA